MWQIILALLLFVMMPKKPAITGSAKLVQSVSFFHECEDLNLIHSVMFLSVFNSYQSIVFSIFSFSPFHAGMVFWQI